MLRILLTQRVYSMGLLILGLLYGCIACEASDASPMMHRMHHR